MALENTGTPQVNIQDASEVYRASYQIAQAQNEEDVFDATRRVFEKTPYTTLFLIAESGGLRVAAAPQISADKGQPELPEWLGITPANLATHFASGILVGEVSALTTLPASLLQMFEQLKMFSVGLIPVMRGSQLEATLVVGSRAKEPLLPMAVQPYASIAELITSTVERMRAEKNTDQRLSELEAITVTSQAISTANSLESLYKILHDHIRQKMGDINFLVALYEQATNSIRIPYLYEKGEDIASLETFPLGEGRTARHVTSESNHHVEIFAELDESRNEVEWDGAVVPMAEAYHRKKQGLPIVQCEFGPKRLFKFSLGQGEVIECDDKGGGRSLFVFRKVTQFSKGGIQIGLAPHVDARKAREMQVARSWLWTTPNTLGERHARKVVVSPLGEVMEAHD